SVKARGGIAFAVATAVEVLPFGPGTSALTPATLAVATSANVVTGTWTVNINAAPPAANNVTITDPNGVISWYTCAGGDTFAENAPIPGVQFVLAAAPVAGDVSQIVCTAQVAGVLGRASLTYDEDVSWTQATGGAYTIYNNFLGWDILGLLGITAFLAYNETTDTMFWEEVPIQRRPAGWDLTQGQWLTFQVDSVADIAGNAISVASPESDNCVVLSPTVAIGP
ncbi:MAG: hypothetical protein KAX30_06435, partial [Candidatus Atribacteria bacterium]|nr:hypothetical protein [Candidatus Atribacteria bacterium]